MQMKILYLKAFPSTHLSAGKHQLQYEKPSDKYAR